MKQLFFTLLLALSLMTFPHQGAWAAEDPHDHEAGHSHDDGHDHEEDEHDHAQEESGHDHAQDGAESHNESDGHNHSGGDGHSDDEAGNADDDDHDGHGHGEEEGGVTEIAPNHAEKAGIKIATAAAGEIAREVILNGQITLNRDMTAEVKARFPGVVRAVPVKLGQNVQQGEVLARLESNESLRDYTLNAPVSGVVLERTTNVGDVAGDAPLFVIADLSTVWAKFHIFPKDADLIREGQKVRVHTVDHDRETDGTIKLFLPTADALSQTHIAIVELDNTTGRWRPGLAIDGHVSISKDQANVVVPEAALQTMEDQTVIFATDGHRYEMRPVKTGKSDGKFVEIITGLKAGEQYVSEGSFIVKADIMKSGAGHDHAH